MTVTTTKKKDGIKGDLRYQLWYAVLESGDTEIVITTGFHRILYHNISPPSVASKYVTTATVSGGTITYTVTNPAAAEYFYIEVLTDI